MKGIILSTVLLVSVLGGSEQACPRSWTQLGKSCYIFPAGSVPWTEARDYCVSIGGYLTEINNADENSILTNMVKVGGADGAWIGLNDLVDEGRVVWTTVQRTPLYINFAPGQPDNFFNQDCFWLSNKPLWWTPGTWDDNWCTANLRFICERSSQ